MFDDLIFRQLFDAASSTYTYLLGCPETKQAVLIDAVFEQHLRDRALVEELGLELVAALDEQRRLEHPPDVVRVRGGLALDVRLRALDETREAGHTRSNTATHSMCGVWGNMSTGRTRRSA